jgi:CubicO group peptidase (beta-lactamase class C family)
MASTAFWVDPKEDLSVIFLTQLIPSSAYPLRRQLRVLVNQALID